MATPSKLRNDSALAQQRVNGLKNTYSSLYGKLKAADEATRPSRVKPSFVVVDTETTGLGHVSKPPRHDAIVQVAMAYRTSPVDADVGDPGEVVTWSRVCCPSLTYLQDGRAKEALRIQGRSEDAILAAPDIKQVAREFMRTMRNLGHPKLLAYNRGFDAPFLQQDPWNIEASAWGDCIMLRGARLLNGPDGRWMKLKDIAQKLHIPIPEKLHDAAADAHLALLVHEALDAWELRQGDESGTNVPVLTDQRGEKAQSRQGAE